MIDQWGSSERCFCKVSYFVTSEANRGVFCFINGSHLSFLCLFGPSLIPVIFQGSLLPPPSIYRYVHYLASSQQWEGPGIFSHNYENLIIHVGNHSCCCLTLKKGSKSNIYR